MNFRISISPANIEFDCNEDNNILAEALTAKINLPHGCKSGNCGACKCQVTNGDVTQEDNTNMAIFSQDEIDAGYVLLCKSHAHSDVTLNLPGFSNSHPIKTLPAKISSIDKSGTTAIVMLKLPAGQKFEFSAGQYIDILYEGQNRSYSLANYATDKNELELHIRYRKGGLFSEAVWSQLTVGSIVRFKGPLGSFTLSKNDKPIVMVCTGTGLAPVKAILEQMIATNNLRPVHLIWGNFTTEDFYLTELLAKWQEKLNLRVSLCVNENPPIGYHNGLVTDLIVNEYENLMDYEVYACGNPQMIQSLYQLATTQLNLSAGNFFSDSFTPSK